MSKPIIGLLLSCILIASNFAPSDVALNEMPTKDQYTKLAAEMEQTLQRDVLGVWFPRSVNKESGGFYSNFTRDWQRTDGDGKFSVFQGRMVWVASQIVIQRPEQREQFLLIVDHGFQFLNDVLWDKKSGGFYWGLDDKNQISSRYTDGKHLYGISFGLYGATAAYQATKNQRHSNSQKRRSNGSTNMRMILKTVATSNG